MLYPSQRGAGSYTYGAEEGRLTLQRNEFARKGKWKESGRFGKVRNLQGTENARKDKLEFARKGNCKEWNLEGDGICTEWILSNSAPPLRSVGGGSPPCLYGHSARTWIEW